MSFFGRTLRFRAYACMNGNGFELLGIKLDILTLADLIALDDVLRRHLIASFSIDLAIPDPVTGLFVELMEADLLAFGRGWEQRDRTRNERQLQITFRIRTGWGHGISATQQNTANLVPGLTESIIFHVINRRVCSVFVSYLRNRLCFYLFQLFIKELRPRHREGADEVLERVAPERRIVTRSRETRRLSQTSRRARASCHVAPARRILTGTRTLPAPNPNCGAHGTPAPFRL